MLITNEIKELIAEIDEASSVADEAVCKLINAVDTACKKPANQKRYAAYAQSLGALQSYPIDADGYAVSFDALHDEQSFYDAWSQYGLVVGKNIVPASQCMSTIGRIQTIFSDMTDGKGDLLDTSTYDFMPLDENKTPLLSRGFFEIYHDDSLAQLRQSVHGYIHHAVIWGRADLWTTFDRYGVKPPHHEEAKGLPLHVDQNPLVHPSFKTLQGVLALTDCPEERGTFKAVPGSKAFFPEYAPMTKNMGEFVELDESSALADKIMRYAQPIPLKAGCMVSWDSRTTHANTANISNDTRIVAYISAGPAREDNVELVQTRMDALQSGFGSNVREALMHASKKSRFTDMHAIAKIRQQENLTLLGKLLYGTENYGKITAPFIA